MQEEVNEKVVALCIAGGKISGQALKDAMRMALQMMGQERGKDGGTKQKGRAVYHGKQSLKKLRSQNAELSNVEVTEGNIRSFEKYARKYQVDYCLKKDRSQVPPRYYAFFKAKDVDAMTAAFREYSGTQLRKGKKLSVRKKLEAVRDRVRERGERERQRERGVER